MSEVSASSAPGYLLASILEESPMSGFSPAEDAPCEPQPHAASFGNFPVGVMLAWLAAVQKACSSHLVTESPFQHA